ncbi:hypothetical protein MNB_SUP05-SYMBIONT-5-381 [hydrothermal vent metagenome]|uniref:FTP domain-containing protein n=1 Tax=hydrothermal vent metagenome TaxID=652676 RepID=A0A1W1E1J1_9ZZZZ
MIIMRVLILCFYWVGASYAWAGFFNINTNTNMPMYANSVNGGQTTVLDQVYSSVLKHRVSLGIDDNGSLLFQGVNTDNFGNQHFRFNVIYHGIEVENMQIIAHSNQGNVSNISGYQQPLSNEFKNKINAHLNHGKTQLNAAEVLAFINQNQHKVLSNKPIIIKTQPYVIWRVQLLINGIETVYDINDSRPLSVLSTTKDIQF